MNYFFNTASPLKTLLRKDFGMILFLLMKLDIHFIKHFSPNIMRNRGCDVNLHSYLDGSN